MTIMKEAETFWRENARDYSHWRGSKLCSDVNWITTGKLHYSMIYLMLSQYSPWEDYSKLSVLEYGCGGGMNVIELCQHFGCVYGMDIAEETLAECVRQVKAMGNFIPMLMLIDRPGAYFRKMPEQVQVFLSTAVYHHFPSKEYGERVTEFAYNVLTHPGFALIQIRYDDGTPLYKPKDRDYSKNVVTFMSYPSDEFRSICRNCGFEVLQTSKTRSHLEYFLLQKK